MSESEGVILTIRVIRSFEYRTVKNLIIQNVSLSNTTVGQLKETIRQKITSTPGFKPFLTTSFDTLKIYSKAHGAKSQNLIINLEHDDDWTLSDDSAVLSSLGIEEETELSWYNKEQYDKFKSNPEVKCHKTQFMISFVSKTNSDSDSTNTCHRTCDETASHLRGRCIRAGVQQQDEGYSQEWSNHRTCDETASHLREEGASEKEPNNKTKDIASTKVDQVFVTEKMSECDLLQDLWSCPCFALRLRTE
ncbi:hypothetical protein PROFUN_00303 [Planoprotostelium fungivorum]|uniref:Uncharacterized protein n=1 Tax=Planoprotostelium fungivorum TaxID=1890364 RepID=A0A2P6NY02_9EUKA|nr:hypothetical protein PROFUN_00303 [Planoprotostelium fungivorum]